MKMSLLERSKCCLRRRTVARFKANLFGFAKSDVCYSLFSALIYYATVPVRGSLPDELHCFNKLFWPSCAETSWAVGRALQSTNSSESPKQTGPLRIRLWRRILVFASVFVLINPHIGRFLDTNYMECVLINYRPRQMQIELFIFVD